MNRLKALVPDRITAVAFLSGVLLALSFPAVDLAVIAWFALIPVLLVMERQPFRAGFVAGIGFYVVVLYWLNIVMTTYGGLHPVFSVVAYLLLVLYLALFFGAATWVSCRLRQKLKLPIVATLPVVWVALEFVRSFLFTGFPWATLGYSQQKHLTFIQSADLFGVYGLSFLLVFTNAALALFVQALRRRELRGAAATAMVAAGLLFAANGGYGLLRLEQPLDIRERTLETSLIQGNIDQSIKWNPGYQAATLEIYRNLSLAAVGDGKIDLLIWPESATPFFFQDGGELGRQVVDVARLSGAQLLFGSPAYERSETGFSYLNSAFLLSPRGAVLGRSDKVQLVPFGEYVPLGRYIPFIDKLVVGAGDFSPGIINPLPMNDSRAGVLVCFEGIFPKLARDYVRQGSDLLVNITNDAWFGRSSAPYQHLAMSRFRAVENRIWLARAANTGISAFVAPSGRITASTPIFETHHLRGTVGLGAAPTFYNRFGDIGPIFFLFISLWWLARSARATKEVRSEE